MGWVYSAIVHRVFLVQSLFFHHQTFFVGVGAFSIIYSTQAISSDNGIVWTQALLSKRRILSTTPTSPTLKLWKTQPGQSKRRIERDTLGYSLDTIYRRRRDNSWAFGMGYSSSALAKFRQEQERYRVQNGGFLPPSACPENRPYIFYCDPRHRKGPINPVTGQPWPNGIFFLPSKEPLTLPTSTSTTTTTTIKPRRLSLRPPCNSILCPVGGNEGYGYTGLEDTVSRQQQKNSDLHVGRNCSSLLCFLSTRQRS